jgi:hypothetical protein
MGNNWSGFNQNDLVPLICFVWLSFVVASWGRGNGAASLTLPAVSNAVNILLLLVAVGFVCDT